MKIDYLGHSEFMIHMKNEKNENIKIMSDSWLSDFCAWDMMARNPRIEVNYKKLENVDAIFLSHSHMDHIDPYSLIDIFTKLEKKPDLLISETLSFLIPIFVKYLNAENIIKIENRKTINYKWLKITWLLYKNSFITNEDDVMTLFVENENEILYTDVDTEPGTNFEVLDFMYKKLNNNKYKQKIYLATRNELEWNLKLLDAKNVKERQNIVKQYKEHREWEIEREYAKFEQEEIDSFYEIENLNKIFIWQWIVFPKEVNSEIFCLNTMKLEEIKSIEEKYAKNYRYNINFWTLKWWNSYDIENNKIKDNGSINYLDNIDFIDIAQNLNLDYYRKIKFSPQRNEKRDVKEQKEKILDIINNRFFPYALANLEIPLKDAIIESPEKKYNIKVRYGTKENFEDIYYSFDFWKLKFETEKSENDYFNEDYWANDLEDFCNGKQELYSNFLHKLDENKTYRLWTFLGANFLNNDIVYKKYDFHFFRAKNKKSINDYVLNFYK